MLMGTVRAVVVLAVLLSLVGCGGKKGGGGGSGDSVTVTALDADTLLPFPGVHVVFHDADGEPIATFVTGTDGTATLGEFESGGMVSLMTTSGLSTWVRTIMAVEAGDDLRITIDGGSAGGAPTPAATPDLVFDSAYGGAAGYAVELGCFTDIFFGVTGNAIDVPPDCVNGSLTYDGVALAGDSSLNALAFAVAEDVAVASSALTFGVWRTDFSTYSLDVTGGTTDIIDVYGSVLSRDEGGFFGTADLVQASSATNGSFSIRMIPDIGTSTVVGLELTYAVSTSADSVAFYVAGEAGSVASGTVDLGAALLPHVTAVSATDDPRPVVSWTAAGAGAGADVVQIALRRSDVSGSHEWIVYAPPSPVSSLTLPALPQELASYAPSIALDSVRVRLLGADFADGFDAFRVDYLDWMPAGNINFSSTAPLAAIPMDEVPTTFTVVVSEGDRP